MRGANRSTRDSSSLPQKVLVIVQAMLSVVLLAGAGMLTHSLNNMEKQDFGFATQDRVIAALRGWIDLRVADNVTTLDNSRILAGEWNES